MTGRFLGLHLRPFRLLAESHHRAMRQEPGSEQIASAFALEVLMALLDKLKPRRVLEVGAGIGTMTAILIRHAEKVYVVEDNTWCAAQMRKYLPDAQIGIGLGYLHHLTVVDGDQLPPLIVTSLLKRGGWVLVEGNRRHWRDGLRISRRPHVAVNLRPFDQSKGAWLIAFEPSPRLRMAFALERAWQGVLAVASRAWSLLTGAQAYNGKRRVYDAVS